MTTRTPTPEAILDVLRRVDDPDVGVNIVDLGLVASVEAAEGSLHVGLVMTTPACPQSGYIADEAAQLLRDEFKAEVAVEVLDEPLWMPERMSDAARRTLGWLP
ncbi:metal-sulfur cluster assembly factor [Telmatospirillum sp. J64-1]|uniref:metal-sulfur cluster assembly factor n=1 Tax=Telmatospirillum sp. J64-1 TaxID=2502183 RepID=UPI00115E6279|nr:metal-sulfur cluster assembly factor [Telmatospirillum sp. J64-1]